MEDQTDAVSFKIKKAAHSVRHLTVGRQLGVILFAVVTLLVVIGFLLFQRLTLSQNILSNIADESVPGMLQYSDTVLQANQLFNALEQLTKANSPAIRRIAEETVQKQLAETEKMTASLDMSDNLIKQLNVISSDMTELSQLIKTKLNYQSHILSQKQQMQVIRKTMQHRFVEYATKHSNASEAVMVWAIEFSSILSDTFSITNSNRLTEIRESERVTQQKLVDLKTTIPSLPAALRADASTLANSLSQLLYGNSGLYHELTAYLKIAGKSRGREHFISNMINDYARTTSKLSYYKNQQGLQQIAQLSQDMESQEKWFKISAIVSAFTLLLSYYLIHSRVVKRLRKLTATLHKSLPKEKWYQNPTQGDEIDELEHALYLFSHTINQQNKKLHTLSLTDGLTKIANRRAFDIRIQQELSLAQRHRWQLSAMLIDVDYFKYYNDHYGHAAGDKTLQKTAEIIQSAIRRTQDFVGRYGGEEFVVILPDTDQLGAEQIAQNMLKAIETANIEHKGSKVKEIVTFSIGIATYQLDSELDADHIMRRVDAALYYSKQNGRFKYTHYDDIKNLYDM